MCLALLSISRGQCCDLSEASGNWSMFLPAVKRNVYPLTNFFCFCFFVILLFKSFRKRNIRGKYKKIFFNGLFHLLMERNISKEIGCEKAITPSSNFRSHTHPDYSQTWKSRNSIDLTTGSRIEEEIEKQNYRQPAVKGLWRHFNSFGIPIHSESQYQQMEETWNSGEPSHERLA